MEVRLCGRIWGRQIEDACLCLRIGVDFELYVPPFVFWISLFLCYLILTSWNWWHLQPQKNTISTRNYLNRSFMEFTVQMN